MSGILVDLHVIARKSKLWVETKSFHMTQSKDKLSEVKRNIDK